MKYCLFLSAEFDYITKPVEGNVTSEDKVHQV